MIYASLWLGAIHLVFILLLSTAAFMEAYGLQYNVVTFFFRTSPSVLTVDALWKCQAFISLHSKISWWNYYNNKTCQGSDHLFSVPCKISLSFVHLIMENTCKGLRQDERAWLCSYMKPVASFIPTVIINITGFNEDTTSVSSCCGAQYLAVNKCTRAGVGATVCEEAYSRNIGRE